MNKNQKKNIQAVIDEYTDDANRFKALMDSQKEGTTMRHEYNMDMYRNLYAIDAISKVLTHLGIDTELVDTHHINEVKRLVIK